MGRVAIIGSGTAGPAAALNIVRRLPGWTVDIFDKAAKPRAVGAGIGFQPIGLTALKKLGLLDTISHHGARIDGIHSTSNGRTVLDVAYSRFHPQLFGLGLHRGVLFESLLAACRAEPGIALQFGVSITSIEQSSDAATLRMENSAKQEAKKLGPYDLVVLADGAHSQLRGVLGIPCWTRRYDYGALFALLPDEKSTFGRTLTQAHGGPGCHETLGFLPTGLPWAGGVDTMVGDDDDDGVVVDRRKADFTTTLYYNLRGEEWDAARASGGFLGGESTEYLGQERQQATTFTTTGGGGGGGGGVTVKVAQSGSSAQRLQAWKDKCCRLMPQAADLVQQGVTDSKQVSFARYSDSVAWRFHAGRVALVGDCAHAMSPQLGQGCNLALIDAEKLVDELVRAAKGGSSSAVGIAGGGGVAAPTTSTTATRAGGGAPASVVPGALAAYTAARWSHVQFYAMQSRILTPVFASRSKALRVARDAAMAHLCRAPFVSTYVHRVLCGAQAPWLFSTIPESEWLDFLPEQLKTDEVN